MNWIKQNWLWVVFWVAFPALLFTVGWNMSETAHAQKPEPRVNITTVWELTPENYRDIEQHCVAVFPSPALGRETTEYKAPKETILKLRCDGK